MRLRVPKPIGNKTIATTQTKGNGTARLFKRHVTEVNRNMLSLDETKSKK